MRSLIAKSLSSEHLSENSSNLWTVSRGRRISGRAAGRAIALGAMTCAVLGVAPLSPLATTRAHAAEADARGPIVSIVSPQYSAELKGTVQILVGIEARKNTPQTIELLVDGVSQSEGGAMALQSYPSAPFNWDTTVHADGPHRLTVIVTDAQGFRGSADVNVYINNKNVRDLTPPALDWLGTKNGDTWRGLVDVKLKVSDNFGVKYLMVMLNPAATPDKKPAAFAWFLNRPPYTATFDSRNAPDGLYTLRALSYDALENEGSAPSVNVTIANNSINPTYVAPRAPANATDNLGSKTPKTDDTIVIEGPQSPNFLSVPSRVTPQLSRPPVSPETPQGARVMPDETTPPATRTERVEAPGMSAGGRLNSSDLLAAAPRPLSAPAPKPQMSTATGQNSVVSRPAPLVPEIAPHATTGREAATSNSAALPTMQERTLSPAAQAQAEQMRIARAATVRPDNAQLSSGNGAHDGSISAPTAAMNEESTRALGGKVLLPTSDKRVLMARTETTPNTNSGALTPLAPSRLPSVSNGQVAVNAPNFPSPNLSGDTGQRSTSPLLAAVPSPSILKNVSKAAITVAALPPGAPGALPQFHMVGKGETLTSIARHYKLPVAVVAAHNKLAPNTVLSFGQKVSLPQTLAISYEGQPVTGDVASMMVGSTGVTPFRFLFEKQGGKLEWDGKNHRVTARNATHQVTLNIGDDRAMVNEKEVMMDLAAFLVSGRTMVPLRFFENALQAKVEWEPATGRLFVAMAH